MAAPATGLVKGADGLQRCFWCAGDPLHTAYHDREWGFPVTDDRRLFEKICLEGFQSGLSWLTILRKRENFRRAFRNFDPARVARFTARDVQRLLGDAGIVRHRGKIESAINNARRCVELQDEFGPLAAYAWRFEPPQPERRRRLRWTDIVVQATSPQSIAMSRDLKRRGWSYVGPTTLQAFMQAVGIVNHHVGGCHARKLANQARQRLRLPALRTVD